MQLWSIGAVTVMTAAGVGHPSLLSSRDQETHYQNRNQPRKLQRINRERRAAGEKPIMKNGSRGQY